MQRYGAPVLLLNLLREEENAAAAEESPQATAVSSCEETVLGEAYQRAVEALNQVRLLLGRWELTLSLQFREGALGIAPMSPGVVLSLTSF